MDAYYHGRGSRARALRAQRGPGDVQAARAAAARFRRRNVPLRRAAPRARRRRHVRLGARLLRPGSSWPTASSADDDAIGWFQYGADTWRDQIEHFVETIVGAPERLHVAGNSLGGYLAVYLAATSPDLVAGLFLLNATPFWGLNRATRTTGLAALAPWRGALPTPRWIRAPLRTYRDSFRSVENVRGLLGLVHGRAEPERLDEAAGNLVSTPAPRLPGTPVCSVVWSPKSALGFDEMLAAVNEETKRGRMRVAMLYGRTIRGGAAVGAAIERTGATITTNWAARALPRARVA